MAEYPFFPLFVDLSQRRVLIVGAGVIAARRAGVLGQFTPNITLVAPQACPQAEKLAASGVIALLRREYVESDLDGADLVLAATDDAALNAEIARACRARRIPVNVASDRTLCDFYFPGIACRGNVVAGVTASGEDHNRARQATAAIRTLLSGEDAPGC